MSAVRGISDVVAATASTSHAYGFFNRHWCAYQAWRKRERLCATLYGMTDRDLKDIGITRSEIEYVVLCDPVRVYPTRPQISLLSLLRCMRRGASETA
jgi:uncharacterized protein YjiS (DUF1127 family)